MFFLFKFVVLVTLVYAQDPLPGIVSRYISEFRSDFGVPDVVRNDYRPLLANMVRLAFHYCVGDSGCDGCIDMSHPDNAGLELSVDYLEQKAPEWLGAGLSKADLYALGAMVAANMALGDAGWESDLSNFEIGRTDCDPSTDTVDVFPNAHVSPFAFFDENFGFSPRETTVIMGAHTLGRAQMGNSGFENFWVEDAFRLGNAFYVALERPPWRQRQIGNQFQWDQPPRNGRPPLMALNSDVFLIRNLMPNQEGEETQCERRIRQCQSAPTRSIVQSFESDQGEAEFQEEFKVVYTTMLRSAGQGLQQELQLVCDVYDCNAESGTPVETGVPEEPEDSAQVCDNDVCLQSSASWGPQYTCANSAQYCNSWSKDMHRCCPNTCGTGSLSESECNSLRGPGSCVYPNAAQSCSLQEPAQVCNSDACLQSSPSWGPQYTCANSANWCDSWSKDMRRCCPDTCGTGPLSESECNALSGSGSCAYPNTAQSCSTPV